MSETTHIFVSRPLRHSEVTPMGNYYSREILNKMVQDWKNKDTPMFGVLLSGNEWNSLDDIRITDLNKVATVVDDMYVDDEGLVVHQRILETPNGKLMTDFVTSGISEFAVHPKMSIIKNDVDDATVVTSAVLYGFSISHKNANPAPDKE